MLEFILGFVAGGVAAFVFPPVLTWAGKLVGLVKSEVKTAPTSQTTSVPPIDPDQKGGQAM